MLDALPRSSPEFARLLETRDDAAVTRVSDDLCLVQTVDFVTPIVDSPYWFGQLAAANAPVSYTHLTLPTNREV